MTTLDAILRDAADPDEPDTEGRTLARLTAAGMTADPRAVTDAVAALHDLAALADGADPRTLVPGIAVSPWLDPHEVARQVLAQRLDGARCVLLRRGAVAA